MSVGLALGAASPALALPAAPPYANCDEARADGAEDIGVGEPGYRPALDRDRDGVACESGEDASGGGSGEGLPAEGSGTGDDESTVDEQTDESTIESSTADDEADQVSVVPQGAAPTGDGSMHASDGALTWWSGALLAAFGAALVGVSRWRSVRP
ncbi:excalibur calcium-binding domain-containing protein [Actinomycetospora sp. CA-101289]|uniref:excalibur calcium-binding domain-containing protein n=1 Tax=Actinomycetospora sp. CA-101289 TaxID=3239893 RepID=UPI003D99ACCC